MQKLSPQHNTSFTRAGRRSRSPMSPAVVEPSAPDGRRNATPVGSGSFLSRSDGGFSPQQCARTRREGGGNRAVMGEELQHTGVVAAIQKPRRHRLRLCGGVGGGGGGGANCIARQIQLSGGGWGWPSSTQQPPINKKEGRRHRAVLVFWHFGRSTRDREVGLGRGEVHTRAVDTIESVLGLACGGSQLTSRVCDSIGAAESYRVSVSCVGSPCS